MLAVCVQIACITDIVQKNNSSGTEVECEVSWYYRPEECWGGRKVCSTHADLEHCSMTYNLRSMTYNLRLCNISDSLSVTVSAKTERMFSRCFMGRGRS